MLNHNARIVRENWIGRLQAPCGRFIRGEILLEEFMKPSAPPINSNMLAKSIEVPANRITAIIKGQRGITGDTVVRLAAFFNTTAEFWLNLQKAYELRLAENALPDKVRRHIEQYRNHSSPPDRMDEPGMNLRHSVMKYSPIDSP